MTVFLQFWSLKLRPNIKQPRFHYWLFFISILGELVQMKAPQINKNQTCKCMQNHIKKDWGQQFSI